MGAAAPVRPRWSTRAAVRAPAAARAAQATRLEVVCRHVVAARDPHLTRAYADMLSHRAPGGAAAGPAAPGSARRREGGPGPWREWS